MARLVLAALAAVLLSGCVSLLDDAYDDQARSQCDQETRPSQRGACHDGVDQNRRERE